MPINDITLLLVQIDNLHEVFVLKDGITYV